MGAYGTGTYGLGVYGVGTDGGSPTPTPRPPELRHKSPGPLLCRVINPRGEWDYLSMHGRTSGLSITWGTPGGPWSAELSLDAPVDVDIPALSPGATFEIIRGASVGWVGRVATITKGTPWQILVDGLGGLATRETAMTTGQLTDIITASIDDEFPWILPDDETFGGAQWTTEDVPITTKLDEVLATASATEGLRWTVSNERVVSSLAEPDPTPTLLVRVSDAALPVGLNKYATRVLVHFNNTDMGGNPDTLIVINAEAEEKFGRVKAEVNLTRSVSYPAATAQVKGQAYLDRVSPRLTLTGSFTVTNGQITTATGGPVDLSNVAGISGRVARLQFAAPFRDALVGSALAIDVQLGEVTYNDDDATLSLAPIDGGPTPAQILFGAHGGGDYIDPSSS